MTFFLRLSRTLLVVALSSLAALISSCAVPSASALEAGDIVLQVSPAEQEIDLVPSQTYTGSFTVENVGREAFTFTLSAHPYQVSGPDYTPVFTTETAYTTLSTWLSFDQNNLELAPGASAEVTYHVNVPADVPGGGQYAAIIVETRDADDTAAMRIVSQIAVLLYAHVSGEQRLAGSLLDQQLPNFLLGAPFTSVATVENTGNLDFDLTHTLTVTDFFTGRTVVNQSTANPDGTHAGFAETAPMLVSPSKSFFPPPPAPAPSPGPAPPPSASSAPTKPFPSLTRPTTWNKSFFSAPSGWSVCSPFSSYSLSFGSSFASAATAKPAATASPS